ncbi:hypothetical protein GWK47_036203 [Chionoecetes opilio]|uniref:Uncharacterized protein n=1 Tax=Chionoecetes opilio TaxID=41210 RepID=A0A8J5D2T0_CHIOP|nr:hypothetical protein GWK47_036203 [Chionoecetes opilio]
MPGSLPGFRGDMGVDRNSPALSNKRGPPSRPGSPESPKLHSGTTAAPQEQQQQPGASSSWPSLVVALWGSVIPKVPILQDVTFTLGDWQVTCRRTQRAGALAQYGKGGPLSEEIKDLEESAVP